MEPMHIQELASHLHVNPRTLWRWKNEGLLHPVGKGGMYKRFLFDVDEAMHILEKRHPDKIYVDPIPAFSDFSFREW